MKIKLLKLADIFIGKALCFLLGYFDYLFNLTPKEVPVRRPGKILVLRPGGMGDFLYLLPGLKALKDRFPDIKLDVVVEKRNRSVRELTDAIDDILVYDVNPFTFLSRLRRIKYDAVIDSEQFHNFSAVFAYLTRAKVRIGFKTNPFRNHLYTHLIDYSLKGREAGEFLKLLEPLGIKEEKLGLEGSVSKDRIKSALVPPGFEHLRERFRSVVLLAPRGEARYRYWAPDKYRRVIKHLMLNPRQGIVLVGGKSEEGIIKDIFRGLPDPDHQLLSLPGKTSLLQLCRIILESDLFVGCDSGTAILAALLGGKTVTLFGSADENKWAIDGPEHLVVRTRLPCSPCQMLGSYKFCKKIDCMAKLQAADVIQAIDKLNTLR